MPTKYPLTAFGINFAVTIKMMVALLFLNTAYSITINVLVLFGITSLFKEYVFVESGTLLVSTGVLLGYGIYLLLKPTTKTWRRLHLTIGHIIAVYYLFS